MLALFAMSWDSLSGDEARSGDSGEERGGVSMGSPAPARAASTRLTISLEAAIDDLQIIKYIVRLNVVEYLKTKNFQRLLEIFDIRHWSKVSLLPHKHQRFVRRVTSTCVQSPRNGVRHAILTADCLVGVH